MSETRIYLDNASTTRISDSVFEAMLPWLKDSYGNASSAYSLGRKGAIAIGNARKICAEAIGAEKREIFFTSGGSESDNWAIKSTAELMKSKGKNHIITTAFEHEAVLESLKKLENYGFEITYLPVYDNGIVHTDDLISAIRDTTALVSVMYVNNEVGTIQPITEIGAICRENNIIFHTDAVQAVGNIAIDVKKQNIDMLSLSGHKIHAPKGTGLLYVRQGIELPSFIDGGGQESRKRAGTENIAGITGLAKAMSELSPERKNKALLPLQNRIIDCLSEIKNSRLNGDRKNRIASNINFSFDGIEGEALILQLDIKGIAVSSASACAAGRDEPSHVLKAMGLSDNLARGSLRISMSEYTTEAEIDELLTVLPETIEKLRSLTDNR